MVFCFVMLQRFTYATHDNPATALALGENQDYVAMLEGTTLEPFGTTRLWRTGHLQLPDEAAVDLNERPCG
jgi:hypothetical protein